MTVPGGTLIWIWRLLKHLSRHVFADRLKCVWKNNNRNDDDDDDDDDDGGDDDDDDDDDDENDNAWACVMLDHMLLIGSRWTAQKRSRPFALRPRTFALRQVSK